MKLDKLNTDTRIALGDVVPILITSIPGSILSSLYGAVAISIILISAGFLAFILDLLILKYTKYGRNRVEKLEEKSK